MENIRTLIQDIGEQNLPYARICYVRKVYYHNDDNVSKRNTVDVEPSDIPGFDENIKDNFSNYYYNIKFSPDSTKEASVIPALESYVYVLLFDEDTGFVATVGDIGVFNIGDPNSSKYISIGTRVKDIDKANKNTITFISPNGFHIDFKGNNGFVKIFASGETHTGLPYYSFRTPEGALFGGNKSNLMNIVPSDGKIFIGKSKKAFKNKIDKSIFNVVVDGIVETQNYIQDYLQIMTLTKLLYNVIVNNGYVSDLKVVVNNFFTTEDVFLTDSFKNINNTITEAINNLNSDIQLTIINDQNVIGFIFYALSKNNNWTQKKYDINTFNSYFSFFNTINAFFDGTVTENTINAFFNSTVTENTIKQLKHAFNFFIIENIQWLLFNNQLLDFYTLITTSNIEHRNFLLIQYTSMSGNILDELENYKSLNYSVDYMREETKMTQTAIPVKLSLNQILQNQNTLIDAFMTDVKNLVNGGTTTPAGPGTFTSGPAFLTQLELRAKELTAIEDDIDDLLGIDYTP